MIITKLSLLETKFEKDNRKYTDALEAIKSIKPLLLQIDYKVEKLPIENSQKLIEVIRFLKEDELTISEINIIEQLAED